MSCLTWRNFCLNCEKFKELFVLSVVISSVFYFNCWNFKYTLNLLANFRGLFFQLWPFSVYFVLTVFFLRTFLCFNCWYFILCSLFQLWKFYEYELWVYFDLTVKFCSFNFWPLLVFSFICRNFKYILI